MKQFIPNRLYFCFVILLLTNSTVSIASDLSGVNIHGIISQGYIKTTKNNWLGDTKDGSFEFNEMGINFTTEVTDKLDMGIQFFAQDKGYFGNDEILIDWAYARYRYKDYFGILGGKMKGAFGLYGEVRDIDSLRTFIILPQTVYVESTREFFNNIKGIGIFGDLPIGLSYKLIYGTTDSPTQFVHAGLPLILGGMVANMFTEDEAVQLILPEIDFAATFTGVSVQNLVEASLEWRSPLDGLRFMISGGHAIFDLDMYLDISSENNFILKSLELSGAERLNNTSVRIYELFEISGSEIIFSMEYTWQQTIVAAEYTYLYFDVKDMGVQAPYAYYISISQRMTDWFGIGTYYSYQHFDPDDKSGKDFENRTGYPRYWLWYRDLCLALQFDLNLNWVAKVEGHYLDGIWQVDVFDREKDQDFHREWFMFCFKLSYSF